MSKNMLLVFYLCMCMSISSIFQDKKPYAVSMNKTEHKSLPLVCKIPSDS